MCHIKRLRMACWIGYNLYLLSKLCNSTPPGSYGADPPSVEHSELLTSPAASDATSWCVEPLRLFSANRRLKRAYKEDPGGLSHACCSVTLIH